MALYADKNSHCKVVESMTTAVKDVLECITEEICMEQKKNIIVCCIYRTPGSNVVLFKDWMEEMFSSNSQKEIFICGDFNIDLLKTKQNKMTEVLLNTMYSVALYPQITRPTRITS